MTAGTRAAAAPAAAKAGPGKISGLLGRRTLEGIVIHAGPSYLAYPSFRWVGFLVRAALLTAVFLIFGMLVLVIAAALFLLSLVLSWIFKSRRSGSGGFFQSIATQFIGYYLTSRVLGARETIPVSDYRVRDSSGIEHLVRVEGYITMGAMNAGDDVVIEGRNRRGTLVLDRGWNKRLRTAIKVKRP